MGLNGSEACESEFSVTGDLKRRLADEIEKVREGESDGDQAAKVIEELAHVVSYHHDPLPGEQKPPSRFMRILKGH